MRKKYLIAIIIFICSFMIIKTVFNKKTVDITNEEAFKVNIIEEDNLNNETKEEKKPKEIVTEGYGNLDNLLEAEAESNEFQGVALVAEGDNILFAKGYGYADRDDNRENNTETRFAIASNTKQFTATAIMKLVDENKISLNETIDTYFPEYKDGNKITIKDLIQMRSGIPDYLNEVDSFFVDEESRGIIKKYETGNYQDKYVEDNRWSSEKILKNLYLTDLYFEPNEMYGYSNTNYYLLGLIIEEVSGLSYEDYLKKYIFKPFKMTSTNLKMEELDAKGHGSDVSGEIVVNPKFTYAAGAIHSNVFDMFTWMRMLHTGQVISEKSYNEMITPVDTYGYGVIIEDNVIRHGGVIDGFKSYTQYDIENDIIVIVLQNADSKVVNLDARYYSDIIREYVKS